MMTKRDHIKALTKNLLLRLEQDDALVLNPRSKSETAQALYDKVSAFVLTDEDIREKAIDSLGKNSDALAESDFSETDQYRAAKAVILSQIGDNAVRGIYFQKPIKEVADSVVSFVMSHSGVEDVFAEDAELEKRIVDFIKKFDPSQLH